MLPSNETISQATEVIKFLLCGVPLFAVGFTILIGVSSPAAAEDQRDGMNEIPH